MEWNLDDNMSIWPQLKEQLMRAIITGEYEEGGPFPTVRQLAQDAGVNRNTMQRAMAELEAEGLLITNRTAGRTVTTDKKLIESIKGKLADSCVNRFFDEMGALGYTNTEAVETIVKKGENDK